MKCLVLALALVGCAYDPDSPTCESDITMTGSPGSQETITFDLNGGESHEVCIALDASLNKRAVMFRASEPFFPNATQLDLKSDDGTIIQSDDAVGLLQFEVAAGTKIHYLLTTTAIQSLSLGVELRLEFREL